MSFPFDAGRDAEEFSVVSYESRPVDTEVPLAQPDVVHSDVSEPSAKSAKAHISDIQISERRAMISTLVDDEVKHLEVMKSFHASQDTSMFTPESQIGGMPVNLRVHGSTCALLNHLVFNRDDIIETLVRANFNLAEVMQGFSSGNITMHKPSLARM